MAGLSGPQNIVNVVAASEKLRPSAPSEPAPPPPPKRGNAMEIAWTCALGHPAGPDCAFCPRCGLPRGGSVPAPVKAVPPRPAAELSPDELAERERLHTEAVTAAAQFEAQPLQFVPAEGETILIHFIGEGLTAFGQVWYRGQELEIGPSHPRWEEALGWITLNRMQQIERWGEQKFDHGPWPGRRSYADAAGSFEQLSVTAPDGSKVPYAGPTKDELLAADAAEARRGRAVPAPAYGRVLCRANVGMGAFLSLRSRTCLPHPAAVVSHIAAVSEPAFRGPPSGLGSGGLPPIAWA